MGYQRNKKIYVSHKQMIKEKDQLIKIETNKQTNKQKRHGKKIANHLKTSQPAH